MKKAEPLMGNIKSGIYILIISANRKNPLPLFKKMDFFVSAKNFS